MVLKRVGLGKGLKLETMLRARFLFFLDWTWLCTCVCEKQNGRQMQGGRRINIGGWRMNVKTKRQLMSL